MEYSFFCPKNKTSSKKKNNRGRGMGGEDGSTEFFLLQQSFAARAGIVLLKPLPFCLGERNKVDGWNPWFLQLSENGWAMEKKLPSMWGWEAWDRKLRIKLYFLILYLANIWMNQAWTREAIFSVWQYVLFHLRPWLIYTLLSPSREWLYLLGGFFVVQTYLYRRYCHHETHEKLFTSGSDSRAANRVADKSHQIAYW